MIVIDTHMWVWWVHDHPELKPWMRQCLMDAERDGIGVSCISCWEVARLHSTGKLDLHMPIETWFDAALSYPGLVLLDLTPPVCVDANSLPGFTHKDPADRIIIATARIHAAELLTADGKILSYPGVRVVREPQ